MTALHNLQFQEQRVAWAKEKSLLEAEIATLRAQVRELGERKEV